MYTHTHTHTHTLSLSLSRLYVLNTLEHLEGFDEEGDGSACGSEWECVCVCVREYRDGREKKKLLEHLEGFDEEGDGSVEGGESAFAQVEAVL